MIDETPPATAAVEFRREKQRLYSWPRHPHEAPHRAVGPTQDPEFRFLRSEIVPHERLERLDVAFGHERVSRADRPEPDVEQHVTIIRGAAPDLHSLTPLAGRLNSY